MTSRANSSSESQMSWWLVLPAWLSRITWSTRLAWNWRSFWRIVSGEPIRPDSSAFFSSGPPFQLWYSFQRSEVPGASTPLRP
jgi:hypothetical protein